MNRAAIGVALATFGGIVFGISATLGGWLTAEIDPLAVGASRVALAGLCLAPLAVVHRAAIRRAPVPILVIGVLQVAINALLFLAIDRVGVGPAMGILFLAPVYVVAWDRVTGRARPRPVTWAAVVAAVVGVGLLVQAWEVAALDPLGLGAAFAGGLGLATYLRLAEDTGARIGALPLASGSLAVGGLIGLVVARPWTFVGDLAPGTLWGLVALGTVAMALPITTEMLALTMVPARVVGVVITLEPVAAAATAWWFLDEALVGTQVVGLVLIVSAVAAVTWTTSRAQTADPVPV